MLPLKTFEMIIEHTPLISIDLVVYNPKGQVLLGYRSNRPAQGFWFVPGGRIQKDESMSSAFKRLTRNELGSEFCLEQAEFIGPFEHFYTDNVSGDDFTTHYVVLGYRLFVDDRLLALPTEQHSQYTWMEVGQLLNHSNVHQHSRWYFSQ
ncbi:GDP-mannose mannosyl hydrolase [Vibrio scophthalmi]|nr:GDP-mannose mannosyl hydrolase [Vibrio scophthalmi]MCY9804053.1 GDP-mannose mannosyl hydrolase [Vibrio scophthalmi]